MKFNIDNVMTEWYDSLMGTEGYFSDYINNSSNVCLKQYIINEGSFSKVEYSGDPEYPFRGDDGITWKYFYPIPEIQKVTENENAETEINSIIGIQCSFFVPVEKENYEQLKTHIIKFLQQMQCSKNDYDFYAVKTIN
jgi:hypothetical protein